MLYLSNTVLSYCFVIKLRSALCVFPESKFADCLETSWWQWSVCNWGNKLSLITACTQIDCVPLYVSINSVIVRFIAINTRLKSQERLVTFNHFHPFAYIFIHFHPFLSVFIQGVYLDLFLITIKCIYHWKWSN